MLPRMPLVFAVLLSGCAQFARVPPGASVTIGPARTVVGSDWRAVANEGDIAKIDGIKVAWAAALVGARAQLPREIKIEAALLEPDAALMHPLPAPGRYRCRTLRLGKGAGPRGRMLAKQPAGFCFVGTDAAWLTFTVETGIRRPGGRLWLDGDRRLVFLGALAAPGATTAPPYGADASADCVGSIERIGDFRWRIVFPPSERDPSLQIVELIPDVVAPALYRGSP